MLKTDTSIEGFAKIGIKITKEQFEDLCAMNNSWHGEQGATIPVFHIIMLLKYLGLLPKEMLTESDRTISDLEQLTGARISD